MARNNQRVYNYDAKISPVIPIGWKSADTTSNGSANWINSGNKKAANDYYKARLASRFIWSPSLIAFSMPEIQELPIYTRTVLYSLWYDLLRISQVCNKHSFENIDFSKSESEMSKIHGTEKLLFPFFCSSIHYPRSRILKSDKDAIVCIVLKQNEIRNFE